MTPIYLSPWEYIGLFAGLLGMVYIGLLFLEWLFNVMTDDILGPWR